MSGERYVQLNEKLNIYILAQSMALRCIILSVVPSASALRIVGASSGTPVVIDPVNNAGYC